jgi:hypothetical protein
VNRDDIIRMAREVGFSEYHLRVLDQGIYRLADLVAAAEREAFDAKYPIQLTHDQYNVVINAALKDEREACAALCFQMWNKWVNEQDTTPFPDAEDCAAAIRERGAP